MLQISVIDGNGNVLFNEYIKPERHDSWEEAENVNHISPDMVKDCEAIAAFLPDLQEIFDSADVIGGYNTLFDIEFLKSACIRIREECEIVDVMHEFAWIYGDWNIEKESYRWKKLSICAEYYGYDWGTDVAHDSLSDARATLFCYQKVEEHKKRLAEKQVKSAVVYFSRAGENYYGGQIKSVEVGNTEIAAGFICEITGADLIRIAMKEPYSDNYGKCVEEAKRDLQEDRRPEILDVFEKNNYYEIIYLGYPIYCGTIPMPVATFLEKYDLKAKRIMPFCTQEGSGIANSITDIKNYAVGAAVGKSIVLNGSNVRDSKEQICEWLTEMRLL